jgi:pimeloyl-ACP methyl ester carboxylesterase
MLTDNDQVQPNGGGGVLEIRRSAQQTPTRKGETRMKDLTPNQRREELYRLLGWLPDRAHPISSRCIFTSVGPRFRVERLQLDLNGAEEVPAYFIRPSATEGPLPVVLYNHAHGGDYARGKDEVLTGTSYLCQPPYAEALTELGAAVLCIDHWGFGERRGRTESAIFKQMLWTGQVMWGMIVYDGLRTLDYLAARPDVDQARIATLGMSMGSTMAWWVAALDERVKVCVDLRCLTDYAALSETGGLDGHGIYCHVPDLPNHFATAEINALIAPRPRKVAVTATRPR